MIDPNFLSQVAYEWVDPDCIELLPHFSHCDRFISQVSLLLKNALETTENRFYAESMATALSAHLIQHYSTKKPAFRDYAEGLTSSKLKRVKEYLRDQSTENIFLEDIAKEIGMSKCSLIQMFKESTGLTPYQYLIKCKSEETPTLFKQFSGGLSLQKFQVAIDYINAHLESSISIKDLAQVTQINSDHYFCRLFKQSTGITPYQYVIGQRIEKAKQLLKQNDLSLVEIAMMCGFSSQSSFNRTFRKLVGTTPKNYRQQV